MSNYIKESLKESLRWNNIIRLSNPYYPAGQEDIDNIPVED